MQFDLIGISLADRQVQASLQVDAAAEAARQLWVTAGDGQAQEYRLTETQARAYKAASYPTPFDSAAQLTYAMIHAEMQAQADAGAITLADQTEIDTAAHDVTDDIIAEVDAANAALKLIKRARRGAKLKIAAATDFADIHAALLITWPSP